MNITDELERLGQLHKDGTLSDEEFAQAKNKLLNAPDENRAPAPNTTLGEAANRYVSFSDDHERDQIHRRGDPFFRRLSAALHEGTRAGIRIPALIIERRLASSHNKHTVE